ncbi:MAG: small basic family protein [Armatimonadetes bacterium]|nr:small basic family protein [Armatimonadota bacterium]
MGRRDAVEGKFQTDAFLSGFVANALIATFLSLLGDYLGINLFLAVVLVIGWRIFKYLSRLRKHVLSSWRGCRQSDDPVDDGDLDSTVGMT